MTKGTCSVEGCVREIKRREYCNLHYLRVMRDGVPGSVEPQKQRGRKCSVEGCEKPHDARDFCAMHLRRMRKSGTPGSVESSRYGGPCIVEFCDKFAVARKLCDGHHKQSRRGLPFTPLGLGWKGKGKERDEHGRKQCRDCRKWLTLDHYGTQSNNADGLTTYCGECNWGRHVERQYKMSAEKYEEMLIDQGGACAICGSMDPGATVSRFIVDHDHSCCPGEKSCGECNRGLLCSGCNLGIGTLGDDPVRLESAARYLRERGQR